jgi:DNA-binding LytR/AlgR family response regulator
MDILIVDDDIPTGRYLKHIVSQVPGVTVVGVAASGFEALRIASEHKPQVVFLDVDMPEMNGLEVAHRMAEWQSDILFIFATAYPNYAMQAFELYSFDYILKPFNEERIKKTLRKINNRLSSQPFPSAKPKETISIQAHGKTYLLKPGEILYIESRRNKIIIKTLTGRHCIKADLHGWKEKLAPYGFVQSHRSYLVNVNQVKEIGYINRTYELTLKSGDKVPLSRSYEKQLRKMLSNLQI